MTGWRGIPILLCAVLAACDGKDGGMGGEPSSTPTPLEMIRPDHFPPMAIPPDNPMTVEGVALGKELFFDPILSIDSTKACGSCHLPNSSFTDNDQFSEGVAGMTARNSMHIVNAGWMTALFWDGRAESLEAQALQPVANQVEMGETWDHVVEKLSRHPDYQILFAEAFGDGEITSDRVVKAIAQFERTLVSSESRFDDFLNDKGNYTAEEELGFELFNNEIGDCFHCHGTVLLTDNQFHNNGLDEAPADSGLAAITGNTFDLGKFKSPSLRNVEFTAPYMHDGRFATLEEVLQFYSDGFHRASRTDPLIRARRHTLTSQEQRAIIAFLKTFSDRKFLRAHRP